MDIKSLKNQADKYTNLYKKLPRWKGEVDYISSRIRWILYKKQIPNQIDIVSPFVLWLVSNNAQLINRSYNQEIWNVLKSSWRALEYFMIDFLNRNRLAEKGKKISHQKWTLEQDTDDKIDLLTTVSQGWEDWIIHITSWIQLTTTESPEHKDLATDEERKLFFKKKQIVKNTLTNRKNIPRNCVPDTKWFMVINWEIQKHLHKTRNNVFNESFRKRRKSGFKKWWPCTYLPDEFFREFKRVCELYERSQYNLIETWSQIVKEERKNQLKINKIVEKEDVYIHTTYKPENNEISYEFFNKVENTENYNFIFSIVYFMDNSLKEKLKYI